MTDIECKKVCKVLGIKDAWLNPDGVACVQDTSNSSWRVYIYEGSFSSALPLRLMKLPSSKSSPAKHLVEVLLKQSADGIGSAIVGLGSTRQPCRAKLVDAYETLESLLVKYDLLYGKKCKKHKPKKPYVE